MLQPGRSFDHHSNDMFAKKNFFFRVCKKKIFFRVCKKKKFIGWKQNFVFDHFIMTTVTSSGLCSLGPEGSLKKRKSSPGKKRNSSPGKKQKTATGLPSPTTFARRLSELNHTHSLGITVDTTNRLRLAVQGSKEFLESKIKVLLQAPINQRHDVRALAYLYDCLRRAAADPTTVDKYPQPFDCYAPKKPNPTEPEPTVLSAVHVPPGIPPFGKLHKLKQKLNNLIQHDVKGLADISSSDLEIVTISGSAHGQRGDYGARSTTTINKGACIAPFPVMPAFLIGYGKRHPDALPAGKKGLYEDYAVELPLQTLLERCSWLYSQATREALSTLVRDFTTHLYGVTAVKGGFDVICVPIITLPRGQMPAMLINTCSKSSCHNCEISDDLWVIATRKIKKKSPLVLCYGDTFPMTGFVCPLETFSE